VGLGGNFRITFLSREVGAIPSESSTFLRTPNFLRQAANLKKLWKVSPSPGAGRFRSPLVPCNPPALASLRQELKSPLCLG